jgi:hypothetical protein
MPVFNPGQSKSAAVPVTVQPSGLPSAIEVFLGPNEATRIATSGLLPFTSLGNQQVIVAPVVMPGVPGSYHVYIDLYVKDMYLRGYQAIEDVVVAYPIALRYFLYKYLDVYLWTLGDLMLYPWAITHIGFVLENTGLDIEDVSVNMTLEWDQYDTIFGPGAWNIALTVPAGSREQSITDLYGTPLAQPFLLRQGITYFLSSFSPYVSAQGLLTDCPRMKATVRVKVSQVLVIEQSLVFNLDWQYY